MRVSREANGEFCRTARSLRRRRHRSPLLAPLAALHHLDIGHTPQSGRQDGDVSIAGRRRRSSSAMCGTSFDCTAFTPRRERSGALAGFAEIAMRTRFKILALVAAVLAVSMSSAALARYPCAPGYTYR